jgi:hypothetical protein
LDEPNYELPRWLPWATTACLAALVACLVELWIIERSRGELLSEQAQLAASAAAAAQNQLEAERILDARQLQDLGAGLEVILLAPPAPGSFARGVAVVDPASGHGQLRLFGTPGQPDDRDYQLWIEGPGEARAANGGVFHASRAGDGDPVGIIAPVTRGCRLILIEGVRGGFSSLGDAEERGSIILASTPKKGGN